MLGAAGWQTGLDPRKAISLVDYYLVKRGRYDVQPFFTPDGIYGPDPVAGLHLLRHHARGAGTVP